jgi:hypothetical protein
MLLIHEAAHQWTCPGNNPFRKIGQGVLLVNKNLVGIVPSDLLPQAQTI